MANQVRTVRRSAVAIVLLGLLCACGNGDGTAIQSQQATVIGAQGGTLTSPDGRATLDIPAGALASDVTFDVTDAQLVPSAQYLLAAFDFQPDGTQFLVPATLTFSYDPATLPPGLLPSQLSVATVVNGVWVPIQTTHDPVAMTISATITHFSVHAAGAFSLTEFNPTEMDREPGAGARAVVSRGPHVFLATDTGLEVYEHRPFPSDDLQKIAALPLPDSAVDIAITGDRLVVMTRPAGGGVHLYVINAQDPANPTAVGTPLYLNDVALEGARGATLWGLAADGDLAVFGAQQLHLIDTSDQINGPSLLHTAPERFEIILCVTMRTDAGTGSRHVYVGGVPIDGAEIFEVVADTLVARAHSGRSRFEFSSSMEASGDFLYVVVEGRLIIFDVATDPENPGQRGSDTVFAATRRRVWVAEDTDDTEHGVPENDDQDTWTCAWQISPFYPVQVNLDGDFLYIAAYWSGARVVDVSNPDVPEVLREMRETGPLPIPSECISRPWGEPLSPPPAPFPDPGTTLEPGFDARPSGLDATRGIAADGRYAFVIYDSGLLRLIRVREP
ncbi:MAG: LVIVD repeat-containing protein [Planctomycetota bacterium]